MMIAIKYTNILVGTAAIIATILSLGTCGVTGSPTNSVADSTRTASLDPDSLTAIVIAESADSADLLNSQKIVLPIEVLGEKGLTKELHFVLAEPDSAKLLYLQIHSPGYKYGAGDKVSVQLNSGDWIDVSNKTATCLYPESHYECIGGAFATVRFTLPIAETLKLTNILRFRFNGTDGVTSGFRVLDFNLRSKSGADLLPNDQFGYSDPGNWLPPLESSQAIAEGRDLWHGARLVESPLTPDVFIKATCADCHATTGMDLKYFNYSNESIVTRSVFHALPIEDGQKIASYIRSLDIEAAGTPWDPPYQPGPGLDDKGAAGWAAGAGLAAVLEHDEEALPYIFPNGISSSAIDASATLNIREIPIAIQLPDWNEWLPRVHPIDAWGEDFLASETNTYYTSEVLPLASGDIEARHAVRTLERWNRSFRRDRSETLNNEYFGGYDSDGVVADYTLGLHQWQAVKTFEVMVSGGYQDKATEVYGDTGERLSWLGNSRSVFDVGPHISGPVQVGLFPHGSPLQNIFMTTAWYELQLIVNAGNRNGLSIRPMDWKYHYGHISDISKWSGVDEPVRYLKSYVKNMQEATNDRCGVGSDCGFYLRHLSPARLVVSQSEVASKGNNAGGRGRTERGRSGKGRGNDKNLFDSLDPNVKKQLIEAVLRVHVKELLRHEISEWPRGDGRQALPDSDYIPKMRSSGKQFDMTSYADHYYRSIPIFKNIGISSALIDSLSGWGSSMWPSADWSYESIE